MTILVPLLAGAGVLGLAYLGKRKTDAAAIATSKPAEPAPISVNAGTASDPNSVRSRMGATSSTATVNAPMTRGAPPNAPKAVTPVVTPKAPMIGTLGVSNKVFMASAAALAKK